MRVGEFGIKSGLVTEIIAGVAAPAIRATVVAAEKGGELKHGPEEEQRLRSAALDLMVEVVSDYENAGHQEEVKKWRDEARALAEAKAKESGGKVVVLEKEELAGRIAAEIRKPHVEMIRRGWGVTRATEDKPAGFDIAIGIAEARKEGAFSTPELRDAFEADLKRSMDLTSQVNQKQPWRLFCELNLRVAESQKTNEGNLPRADAMLTTFMSSRAFDHLFRRITPENEGVEIEAMREARRVADVSLVEAVLDEVKNGLKRWDLGDSPIEKLLAEKGLAAPSVATGMNRGFAWKVEGNQIAPTESVMTDSRVAWRDRSGRYWIFDAVADQGNVQERVRNDLGVRVNEAVLAAIAEVGNDQAKVRERLERAFPTMGISGMTQNELLAIMASVRSIPTLVTHAKGEVTSETTMGSLMRTRNDLQREAARRGLNSVVIVGEPNFRLGHYEISGIFNHSVRDGVEGGNIIARIGRYFQDELAAAEINIPDVNLAKNVIETSWSKEKELLLQLDPDFFKARESDLNLGEVFPKKDEMGDLPGQEVCVTVEVTHLWEQAVRIAKEFRQYRDKHRKDEKTILVSPYFVMEMMMQHIHQSLTGAKEVGVLVAQKGMKDLDLHSITQGVDVLELEGLISASDNDEEKRRELDTYLGAKMDQVKGNFAESKMDPIEKVARVADQAGRSFINWMSNFWWMKEGKRKLAGREMLSLITPAQASSGETAIDGPAMDLAQERAMTISGWTKIKGGSGNRVAVTITLKRNKHERMKVKDTNRELHDFASRFALWAQGREGRLAERISIREKEAARLRRKQNEVVTHEPVPTF